MVFLNLAYIHYWMDLHCLGQFQFAGIVPNHPEYGEKSHILWLECAYIPLELEIPSRQQYSVSSLNLD